MSKAMLILDEMPGSCAKCPLEFCSDVMGVVCTALQGPHMCICEMWEGKDEQGRLSDCPLRPEINPSLKWIDAKDQLPEVEKPVLAIGRYNQTGDFYYGWLKRTKAGELHAAVMEDTDFKIEDGDISLTYWMPLPKPPE